MSRRAPEPPDWYEDEGALHSWRRELVRLKRRARARLPLTLTVTLLATAAAVVFVARRTPPVEARVLIRVTESSLMKQDSALTGDLAEYLRDAAFTSKNLEKIVERRGLYPLSRARGMQYAVEKLRWDLTVEVYRNYFLERRGFEQPLRTARISVRFQHKDRETAMAVARDLAQLVIDSESKRREHASGDLAGLVRMAQDNLAAAVDRTHTEMAERQAALELAQKAKDEEAAAVARVDLMRLAATLKSQEAELRSAREARRTADLQHALDARGLGIVFEVVDERAPAPPPDPRDQVIRLAMLGLACFLLLLPLCAIGVGAFDQRLHDREDVQRLGLTVVGHVPGFPGARVGSMRARQAADRRRTRAGR